MSFYVLMAVLFSLIGICGMQFLYMIYIERMDRERRKRLAELEKRCVYLTERLKQAEAKLAQQEEILNSLSENEETRIFDIEIIEDSEEEIWADIIEDNSKN
ncbi:MAG: hypothetical protein N2Z23_04015 [Pyrinomonadaceae bacterium]|nr:hypothetical protein [Pyrinomonadaceae bacterium]MCX7639594.1 hypothetical protein [Pyrinomonadaceae bacterium]MDW8303987.1 hypothetical protein [Acidobacteriota bacterium]